MKKRLTSILMVGMVLLAGCGQGTGGPAKVSRTQAVPPVSASTPGKPSGQAGVVSPSTPAPGGSLKTAPDSTPRTPPNGEAATPGVPNPQGPGDAVPVNTAPAPPRGIAVNPVGFTNVGYSQAPPAVQNLVDSMKEQAGTQTAVVDGETYAVITAGQKPSGGYQVLVNQVSDSEGKVQVAFTVTKPEGPAIAVITYPFAIVKFQGHGLPVTFQGAL